MRIAHLSDTHLGFTDFDKVSPAGINQREEDCYKVFHEAVDKIISLTPDVVVHTGDFFHRPCPTNRALIEAFLGLKKLSASGIPTVIIAGNHSTPRTVYTSPILTSFRSLDNVYPIFDQRYENVTIADAVIHGVPHVNDEAIYSAELRTAKPHPKKTNILLLHTAIGLDHLMEEYGERIFPRDLLSRLDEFDYTALGHFHATQKIKTSKNAWYAGSTERFSEREAGKDKGFLLATVNQGKPAAIEFIPLSARPWHIVVIERCADKSVDEIRREIRESGETIDCHAAIVSLKLSKLKPVMSLDLPNQDIAGFFPGALIVQTRRTFIENQTNFNQQEIRPESLPELFESFTLENVADKKEALRLVTEAKRYFATFEREENPSAGANS